MKSLNIAYYVLSILASIAVIIMLLLSIYSLLLFCPDVFCSRIMFFGIFLVKLLVAIIASIKAKTILNNMNHPLTHDIEMNDIANVDQTEQTTNKSE